MMDIIIPKYERKYEWSKEIAMDSLKLMRLDENSITIISGEERLNAQKRL